MTTMRRADDERRREDETAYTVGIRSSSCIMRRRRQPGIIRVLIGFCVGVALMTTGRPRLLPLAPINHDESTMGLPPQND